MTLIRLRTLFSLVALALATTSFLPVWAADKLRISLDTNPSHVRNKGVDIFVTELKKRVGDKLVIEVYPSAQLFRDRDIPKALRQDAVEMAVPGTWQLDGVEPNAAIQTLPMFYGVDGDTVHTVMDGKLGVFLSGRLEKSMRVKVLGKWFDLGMQNAYGIKTPINNYEDFKGKKIRHSGGSANAARLSGLGANPVLVPFPDLPMAMSQGIIDGVCTTHESAWSSKLHESGLKYAFEDDQFMGQYVPMISLKFWNKQPKNIQTAILEAWDVAATQQRAMAAKAQGAARENLIKAGMIVVKPKPADLLAKRRMLVASQDALVKKMKIDPEAVAEARAGLTEAKVAL